MNSEIFKKINRYFFYTTCLVLLFACQKNSDGFWNLNRFNRSDLLNTNVSATELANVDFSIKDVNLNSFKFEIAKSVLNSSLRIEESGICFNEKGMPEVNENNIREWVGEANGLKSNTEYFVRAYIKVNNTNLADSDPRKYFTVYTNQKTIRTPFGICFDFKSTNSFLSSEWQESNFWITSNPYDNTISNSWIATGVSSINQMFYSVPANIFLDFECDLSTNQNIEVKFDNVIVRTIVSSGIVSIPLPVGSVNITMTANDNNASDVIKISNICLK